MAPICLVSWCSVRVRPVPTSMLGIVLSNINCVALCVGYCLMHIRFVPSLCDLVGVV
jgi:hypothetical protein